MVVEEVLDRIGIIIKGTLDGDTFVVWSWDV